MKRFSLLVLTCCITVASYAQSLDIAINYLKENKRDKALEALRQINDTKDKAEALLWQSIIYTDKGDYQKAFSYFRQFYQNHPEPYAYVYAFATTGIFTLPEQIYSTELKNFFLPIINDTKAPLCTRSFAAEQVARHYRSRGDIEECKRYYNYLSDVKNWSTVGVFENISTSGFNKDFGVLDHPENDYKFINKLGAQVKWFPMGDGRRDRWWDMEYHYDVTDAIIYAQTFVEAENDMEVKMMAGVSGSMKLWVNDLLVGQESEERNTDNDVYTYKVKLNKGYNRLLLQLGSGELERNNFMIRIASLNDQLLSLNSTAAYKPYSKAQPYEVTALPFYPEKYFEQRLKDNPASLLDMLMLVNVYNHNDKRYEARKIAAKLKKQAPLCTIVSEVTIEALNRDYNGIDATKEMESIKTYDPESLYSLILLYNEAEKNENWDEALKMLNKRIELYGANAETDVKMLTVLAKKNQSESITAKVNEGYNKYPYDLSFAALKYVLVLNNTKDVKKANEVLKDFLKHGYDEKYVEILAENYLKTGDKSVGLKTYRKLIEDEPCATNRYATYAATLFDLDDKETALEWMQKAIDKAPYLGSYYYSKGLIYDALKKTEEAKQMMQQSIYYNPTNYDARKKLRSLEGKKDLFSYFKENDVMQLYKDALQKNSYSDKDVAYLLQDQCQIVHPEHGASEERTELLIHIISQKGISEYKEINLPYNAYTQRLIVEKAELFKSDGSKVTAESNDNYLVFSSLEKGDAIHITYKIENSYRGKLAEHFWEEVFLNGSYPAAITRYSLITPSNKKFTYKVYNTNLKAEETIIDNGYKMYVWEKKDIPGMESEPLMPAAADIAERIVVTSIPDWSYIANWYSDLSANKIKVDFEITEKVKELFADKQQLSDYEKAKTIYEFIEQNFSYSNVPFLHSAFVPQRASRTLAAKLGDCKDLSSLFVAMCKAIGLEANLVLVDTRDNGNTNVDLPTVNFNHCIAQLPLKDEYYLIELTNNHLPFGTLPGYLLNANSLFIPKDGIVAQNSQLVKLNYDKRPTNGIIRNSEMTLKGMHAEMHRISARLGAEAAGSRENYKGTSEADRLKDLTTTLSGEFNKNVRVSNFKITNDNNLNDTMLFDYSFSVDNYSSEIAGMQVFKLPWTDMLSTQEIVSLEQRKLPLDIWYLYGTQHMKETILVHLPAGKKLLEIPKNINIKCAAISYELKYELKNNKLYATREVNYLKDKVAPEEYEGFKHFITQMNEADNKQLAIK